MQWNGQKKIKEQISEGEKIRKEYRKKIQREDDIYKAAELMPKKKYYKSIYILIGVATIIYNLIDLFNGNYIQSIEGLLLGVLIIAARLRVTVHII